MQIRKNFNTNRNDQYITAKEVRLIDQSGNMVGIVPTQDATRLAKEAGLDLVVVAPDANPPVCKILDYSKYKYEARRKISEAKKKQKIIKIKEFKLKPNIDPHDYDIKLRNILKHLEEGHKIKVNMRFSGREMRLQLPIQKGKEVFNKLIKDTEDIVKLELPPKMDGNQLLMILVTK
ncbi:MAG: translation initiation factor IF-3 [Wolbachia endosymbiont of Xenopsylla cheopis]